jgi:hypothetical protein
VRSGEGNVDAQDWIGALLMYSVYVIEWNADVEILQLKDVLDFTPRRAR